MPRRNRSILFGKMRHFFVKLILNPYFKIVNQLNTYNLILVSDEEIMKHQYSSKERNELKLKMATVFSEKIQTLSTELQEILLDDLVSAFENRLKVLNRAQSNLKLEIAERVSYATVQT